MKTLGCSNCGSVLADWEAIRDRPLYYSMEAEPLCASCFAVTFRDLTEFETHRRIAFTQLGEGEIHVDVSTVLIGIDHNFTGQGPPLIFETMIFPFPTWTEVYCERYATKEAALAGHDRAIEWAKKNLFLFWEREPQPEGEQ